MNKVTIRLSRSIFLSRIWVVGLKFSLMLLPEKKAGQCRALFSLMNQNQLAGTECS